MRTRDALILILLASCGDTVVTATDLTGIRLTVSFPHDLGLDQLAVASFAGSDPLRSGTIDLSESAAQTGTRQETVVILFADRLAGSPIDLRVQGIAAGSPKAEGLGRVTLQLAALVDLTVVLSPIVVKRCGDGAIQDEACDDGNNDDDDGCSEVCTLEDGFECSGEPSVCTPICVGPQCNPTCGDAAISAGEECDDGNPDDGDGCSRACAVEAGWTCSGVPSVCTPPASCGDGAIDDGETCDDGNTENDDGCSRGCAVEPGWACSGEPSQCVVTCGNGAIDAGEGCDDQNLDDGDGCSGSCQVEPGYDCAQPGPCTAICGDGLIRIGEECDDANVENEDGCSRTCAVEPGFTCSQEPSVCTRCGNNAIDRGELCDGAQVDGETCLSRGHLTGVLGCNSTCTDYDVSACGPLISSVFDIQQAIDEAYAIPGGPEIVAIPPGSYGGNGDIVFDEGNPPAGLFLRPLAGPVTIEGMRFRVRSGSNTIRDLELRDAPNALFLEAGPQRSGENALRNMLFSYVNVTPGDVVVVASDANRILASRIENQSGGVGQNGFLIDGATRSVLAMNAVYGVFENAIHLLNVTSGLGNNPTLLDQNSVWMPAPAAGVGLRINNAEDLCYRNNIVWGSGMTTGIDVAFLGLSGFCPGGSGNNLTANHAVDCNGPACIFECSGGAMCDRAGDPGFDQAPAGEEANLCVRPSNNALVDTGLDLGYDMVDDDAAFFFGNAPDLGARESGADRSYGGVASTCP